MRPSGVVVCVGISAVVTSLADVNNRNQQDLRHYLFIPINILYVVKATVSLVIMYYFAAKLSNTQIIPLNRVETRKVSFDCTLRTGGGGLIIAAAGRLQKDTQ